MILLHDLQPRHHNTRHHLLEELSFRGVFCHILLDLRNVPVMSELEPLMCILFLNRNSLYVLKKPSTRGTLVDCKRLDEKDAEDGFSVIHARDGRSQTLFLKIYII